MKKIIIALVTAILIATSVVPAYASGKQTRNNLKGCTVSGCIHTRAGNSTYCSGHKCAIYECNSRRISGSKYCSKHKGSTAKTTVEYGKTVTKPTSSSGKSSYSSKKSSGKKYTYHDSYDEGWEDIYDNEDYDEERYRTDSDYANGVDDAMDEFGW